MNIDIDQMLHRNKKNPSISKATDQLLRLFVFFFNFNKSKYTYEYLITNNTTTKLICN